MASVTVQSGDTLSRIAALNNTTVAALVRANNIQNPDLIFPGQQIVIPDQYDSGSTSGPCPSGSPGSQNPLQQLLAQNPSLRINQDLINFFYGHSNDTWAGAAALARQYGVDLNALVANRQGLAAEHAATLSGAGGSSGASSVGHVQSSAKMQQLVQNALQVAREMQSTGWCAKAVSTAIERTFGFRPWVDGKDMDNDLRGRGWTQVHLSLEEALKIPGLVLVWEEGASAAGKIYGHTAITQGDGRSSISDYVENPTTNSGRSGLSIWAPP